MPKPTPKDTIVKQIVDTQRAGEHLWDNLSDSVHFIPLLFLKWNGKWTIWYKFTQVKLTK